MNVAPPAFGFFPPAAVAAFAGGSGAPRFFGAAAAAADGVAADPGCQICTCVMYPAVETGQ